MRQAIQTIVFMKKVMKVVVMIVVIQMFKKHNQKYLTT